MKDVVLDHPARQAQQQDVDFQLNFPHIISVLEKETSTDHH